MNRVRFMRLCIDCGDVLEENSGVFKCSCKDRSRRARHERGTERDEHDLAEHGFKFVQGVSGDNYYLGFDCHIIHFHSGNQWDSDKAPHDCYYLEEYIAWIESKMRVS